MANRRGLVIGGTAAALGLAAAFALWALGSRGPSMAPDFAVPTLGGEVMRLSSLRGRVVLVNLWTTWCPPCREEMPSMERLYQRFKAEGLEVLAVSEDTAGREVVEAFVREAGISFPVLHDPEQHVGRRYGVWGYPETFLVDREGRIVERIIGPREWDGPSARAMVEAVLRTRPPGLARNTGSE